MWYAIDFGFSNSHNAMVRCMWDADNKTIYYHEIDYTTGRQPKDIATLLREDWLSKKTPYRDWETDRKSTRLNSSHSAKSRMPSSA